MAYTPHVVVKPEHIAQTAAVLLEESLVVPATFRREGIDQYKGQADDTINVKVEGVLPWREYGFRNDRSTPIEFDQYKERTVKVDFGGDIYDAVELTDEQADFDNLGDWTKLAAKQVEGIGRGLEYLATKHATEAPFAYTVGVHEARLRAGLIEARRVMNALRLPTQGRTILLGTNWEAAALNDPKLTLAHNVGDNQAETALRTASLGTLFGFNLVVAQELDPDDAIAMIDSAFIFATGAPRVPRSVAFGATAAHNGVALRWLRDYDLRYTTERSLFNTYKGFRTVTDIMLGQNAEGQAFVGEYEHFVRAIKLRLNGTSVFPAKNGGTSEDKKKENEIATITKLQPRDVSTAPSANAPEIPEA
ncbi:hypothetical protein [Cellulosimicrobium sp. TH-20]|uniref:hypothetical protein n=1 Tax=Cellulosimicrobium sp. TH-20 TaxID=1980001 RepID=UPI0011A17409|nr:hypothetical protein [Cellulosimicrobium sp. TH-20]